ncbi:MAG: Ppx/GppA family phosphatase, partial [Balneolaceae bacterium]|nr:Ppx/GppA family phosphatase [Balneolaceae bacterium]
LQTRPFDLNPGRCELNLIGVAGTVTSLAYMDLGLTSYDADRINGYKLSAQAINRWVEKISASSMNSLEEQFPVVMKGRAEVILAGVLILEECMHLYGLSELTVSTGGIRHGAILHVK